MKKHHLKLVPNAMSFDKKRFVNEYMLTSAKAAARVTATAAANDDDNDNDNE
jgi:hypothetical protein